MHSLSRSTDDADGQAGHGERHEQMERRGMARIRRKWLLSGWLHDMYIVCHEYDSFLLCYLPLSLFFSSLFPGHPRERVYFVQSWFLASFCLRSICLISGVGVCSPGPAASLGSRSLSTIGVRSRVCHAPIPAFGYRWCGVGHVVPWSGIYRATTKCLESWFYFF